MRCGKKKESEVCPKKKEKRHWVIKTGRVQPRLSRCQSRARAKKNEMSKTGGWLPSTKKKTRPPGYHRKKGAGGLGTGQKKSVTKRPDKRDRRHTS